MPGGMGDRTTGIRVQMDPIKLALMKGLTSSPGQLVFRADIDARKPGGKWCATPMSAVEMLSLKPWCSQIFASVPASSSPWAHISAYAP